MKKKLFAVILLSIVSFSLFAASFDISSYHVDVTVGRNAVHHIKEDLTLDYLTESHGFYRSVPYNYEQPYLNAKISHFECSDEYEQEVNGDYYDIRIGSSEKTYLGEKSYTIEYDYDLGYEPNEGFDQFYYNILGSDWGCNVKNFSFTVRIPTEGIDESSFHVWLTYGTYGSSETVEPKVTKEGDWYVIEASFRNIKPYEAVTLRAEMNDNWYQNTRQPMDARPVFRYVAPIASLVLVAVAYLVWTIKGKDDIPVITAQFSSPEGFPPVTVGYLIDGQVDDKDITSMIFYWADKGYLTINEKRKNKFTFTKKSEIDVNAPDYEKILFNSFFRRCNVGDTVNPAMLQRNKFYEAMMVAKTKVHKLFTKDKALYSNSTLALATLFKLIAFIPLVLANCAANLSEYTQDIFFICLMASVPFVIVNSVAFYALFKRWYIRKSNIFPCILSCVPTVGAIVLITGISAGQVSPAIYISLLCSSAISFFASIMSKRSEYGNRIFEQVLGFREYIDKVTMPELKMMIKENPDFYYSMLTYAIVLGLENKWASKFDNIVVPQPNWYVGDSVCDVLFVSHLASRLSGALMTSVRPQATSGKTGLKIAGAALGSTGFAGGGFGGGGGRAW